MGFDSIFAAGLKPALSEIGFGLCLLMKFVTKLRIAAVL